MKKAMLRIYTGRKVAKKILFWKYEADEFFQAERRASLQFYKEEFLKLRFPFLMVHPTSQGFSGRKLCIGYCWIRASEYPQKEARLLCEAYERLKKSAPDGEAVGYIPPGFWGNPKNTIGGDWTRSLPAALAAVQIIPRQRVWEIIEHDLSSKMALEDSAICLPYDEPGFLAPFEV